MKVEKVMYSRAPHLRKQRKSEKVRERVRESVITSENASK